MAPPAPLPPALSAPMVPTGRAWFGEAKYEEAREHVRQSESLASRRGFYVARAELFSALRLFAEGEDAESGVPTHCEALARRVPPSARLTTSKRLALASLLRARWRRSCAARDDRFEERHGCRLFVTPGPIGSYLCICGRSDCRLGWSAEQRRCSPFGEAL